MRNETKSWNEGEWAAPWRVIVRLVPRRAIQICCWIVLGWLSVCANSTQAAFQQDDQSLREFNAPSPAELFQILSSYRPQSESSQPLDADRINELEKKGREFLSTLTPEQQELAWKLAKNYLQNNDVDSPASKALMDQFGVPSDLQKQLTDRFQDMQNSRRPGSRPMNPTERDSFLEAALRKARSRAMQRSPQTDSSSLDRTGQEPSQPDRKPDASTPASKNPNNRLPNQSDIDQPTKVNLDDPRDNGKQIGSENTDRQPTDSDRKNSDSTNRQNRNRDDQQPKEMDLPDPRSQNRQTGERNASVDRKPNLAEALDPFEQLKQQLSKSDSSDRNAGMPNMPGQNGDAFDWEEKLREIVQQSSKSPQSGSSTSDQPSNDAYDLDAKSSEALAKAFEKFNSKDGLPFKKKILEGLGKTLSRSKSDSAIPKERLTARFDRLLVDVAKKSLDAEAESGSDLGVSNSLSSMLGKIVDRFNDVKDGKSRPGTNGNENGRSNRNSRSATNDQNSTTNSRTNRSPLEALEKSASQTSRRDERSHRSFGQTNSSAGGGINLMETFSDLPKFNPGTALTFVVMIGFVLLAAFMLMRRFVVDEGSGPKRKFGKRFRKAKIQSPSDLVEAVDYFLISKFGSDSRWWNASHAQDVLCAGAPGYSEKISHLIKDYIRARYMRAGVKLSEAEQKRYKQTLQELAKPAEKPIVDSSTGMEG